MNRSNIRAVLFDLDETLLDRTSSLTEFVLWQAKQQLHLDTHTASKFLQRFIMLDNHGKLWKDKVYQELLVEFQLSGFTVEKLLSTYEQEFCRFARPNAGVVEIVDLLIQKQLRLGLISNGKWPFQEDNFKALNIADAFECIVISEKVGLRKPDPAIFHFALNQMQLSPDEVLFVGDDPVADMQGAEYAGIRGVFYNRNAVAMINKPFAMITDMLELKNLLD